MVDNSIRKPSFFFIISVVGVIAVLVGFAKTFFLPVAAGTFTAPVGIHIHGAFAFAWIILFVIQTFLIHIRRHHVHRTLGIVGLVIAAGVSVTMVPAGVYVVQRELAQGLGGVAYSSLLGVITSGILFLVLVIAGLVKRNKSESHKRYMLLATIVVLWPAWFRFRHYFPSVPHPEIWFALVLADSLIVISWVWDKFRNGKIHPVLKYAGSFIILEQTFEVLAFDHPAWRTAATWIYHVLVG